MIATNRYAAVRYTADPVAQTVRSFLAPASRIEAPAAAAIVGVEPRSAKREDRARRGLRRAA